MSCWGDSRPCVLKALEGRALEMRAQSLQATTVLGLKPWGTRERDLNPQPQTLKKGVAQVTTDLDNFDKRMEAFFGWSVSGL